MLKKICLMLKKIVMNRSLLIFWVAMVSTCLTAVRGQNCIPGVNHHKTAQKGGQNFTGICSGYKDKTCCKDSTAQSIDRSYTKELYAHYHDDCGTRTPACDKYLKAESCFYECSPYLYQWHVGQGQGRYIPLCAKVCDDWYNACKHDQICHADFIAAFIQANGSDIRCPTDKSTCKTFAQWYNGSAKKMCETMFGPNTFIYTTGTDCMTFTAEQGKLSSNACVTKNGTFANAADCTEYRRLSGADGLSQTSQLIWLLPLSLLAVGHAMYA